MGLGLIAAALAGGRALYGAINANQKKQRNKGYIEANYRLANEKLHRRQAGIRQGTDESLIARGMMTNRAVPLGDFQPATAKLGAKPGDPAIPVPATPRAHDLGGQVQQDLAHEFTLEQKDLDQQKSQALRENRAMAANEMIDSVVNSVGNAVGLYNAGSALQDANAADTSMRVPGGSIREAMGLDSMPGAYGVDIIDPLGAPGSAWNRPGAGTVVGGSQQNSTFNVG